MIFSIPIFSVFNGPNIGIEKIIANVISNPHIRYLVICGDDIRGHRSGTSLVALHENGINNQHKIIDAPGTIPYIENLKNEAIKRFQDQVEIINLIGVTDSTMIDQRIEKLNKISPPSYGKPYIAIRIKVNSRVNLTDKRAIHAKIVVNYLGMIKKRGK
jgi:tetrahydromethanopterin S-methyltransferase subunit A